MDERLFDLFDAGGSTTAITDVSGTVQERYAFNQDGEPTFRKADRTLYPAAVAAGGAKSPFDWQYLYHGMRWQPMNYPLSSTPYSTDTAGLYQSIGGMYDPRSGRNLQPDPMAYQEGRNAYTSP